MLNIEKIRDFLNSNKDNCLLINQVNDEIGSFYLYVVIYLSSSLDIKINLTNELDNITESSDLFGLKKVHIFNLLNSKKLDKLLSSSEKSIVFTDYKNFKKYQKNYQTINGYNFSNDLKTFVKSILKIENQNLIEICLKNPQLILSETSKYLINKENYLKDESIHLEINKILEIRKKIFELKKDKNLQQLFSTIKEEVKYKKFNFLTY